MPPLYRRNALSRMPRSRLVVTSSWPAAHAERLRREALRDDRAQRRLPDAGVERVRRDRQQVDARRPLLRVLAVRQPDLVAVAHDVAVVDVLALQPRVRFPVDERRELQVALIAERRRDLHAGAVEAVAGTGQEAAAEQQRRAR